MTAPREHVHVEPGRVGKLDQKNPISRNRIELPQIGPAGVDVEAVEHEADGRMVGAPDDFPGVAVVVDMTPPGQRLESNPQPAPGRAFAKFPEIGCRAIDAAARFG
jgi:hypothetical protein